MDLNKQNIETFLSNLSFQNSDEKLLDNNLLSNVQLFGSEIIIDLQIQNPTPPPIPTETPTPTETTTETPEKSFDEWFASLGLEE